MPMTLLADEVILNLDCAIHQFVLSLHTGKVNTNHCMEFYNYYCKLIKTYYANKLNTMLLLLYIMSCFMIIPYEILYYHSDN